jgi:hypothetical protein
MKSFVIVGKLLKNGKKGTVTEEALDKQEVWGTPTAFGFTKVFSVEEYRGVERFDKRGLIEV